MGAVGEVERSGAVGGSAPELRRLVEGDTIKEGTVFSGDMAKFGHVVGGIVAVEGQNGLNNGGDRV